MLMLVMEGNLSIRTYDKARGRIVAPIRIEESACFQVSAYGSMRGANESQIKRSRRELGVVVNDWRRQDVERLVPDEYMRAKATKTAGTTERDGRSPEDRQQFSPGSSSSTTARRPWSSKWEVEDAMRVGAEWIVNFSDVTV